MTNKIVIIEISGNLENVDNTKLGIIETSLGNEETIVILIGDTAPQFVVEHNLSVHENRLKIHPDMAEGFLTVKNLIENTDHEVNVEAHILMAEYPLFKYLSQKILGTHTNNMNLIIIPLGTPVYYHEIMNFQSLLMIQYLEKLDETKIV